VSRTEPSIEAFLLDYASAFDAFDAERIAACFHCPCLMVDRAAVAPLETPEAILANTRAIFEQHRAIGYARAEVSELETTLQAGNLAIARVRWRVFREDGSLLWDWRNTYNLVAEAGTWRILVATTHAPDPGRVSRTGLVLGSSKPDAMDTRRARPEDLPGVSELLQSRGLPALPLTIPLSNLLVGFEAGALVAAAALEVAARRGLIAAVVVTKEHAEDGTAASLVRSLIARAHELGLRELYALGNGAEVLGQLDGFESVPGSALPQEIRSLPSYAAKGGNADGAVCLELETRL